MTTTFEAVDGTDFSDQEKLLGELGQLNLSLLEQIREGHIQPQMKILEICCGYGHNIRFFIKHGYKAYGIDSSDEAIQLIKEYLPGWNSSLRADNFQVGDPLSLPFEDNFFDYVYSLHLSEQTRNTDYLTALLKEALRVLKSSGVLFLQIETNIGLDGKVLHLIGNRYLMQDGHEKVLLSEKELNHILKALNCRILPPLTTLMYHSKKSYTYLSLSKN
jgi:ubiquinone/menaquinone biosynthesis C-methylase UbiE